MDMGAKTLLTLEEFMALPGDGVRHELNQGELITMTPPSAVHAVVVEKIRRSLAKYVDENRIGLVLVDAGYLLFRAPEKTVRQPDVSYLSQERVARAAEALYFEGAPLLAVEVVSPGDSAADLQLKIRQYLEAGAAEVCIAYPSTRSIQVYLRGGREYTANETDSLTTDLFPGWSARVSEFFDLG